MVGDLNSQQRDVPVQLAQAKSLSRDVDTPSYAERPRDVKKPRGSSCRRIR